jgi:hypothetical protein
MQFSRFGTAIDNPQTEKHVAHIRVGFRVYNATGQIAVTDLLFQEGNKETGYAPPPCEMLVSGQRRRVNGIAHSDTTFVLYSGGSAACGVEMRVAALSNCSSVQLSQGYGGQRLTVQSLSAGNTLAINSKQLTVKKNGVEAPHSGFFPFVQGGMSRHRLAIDGTATVLFDYTEREEGAKL